MISLYFQKSLITWLRGLKSGKNLLSFLGQLLVAVGYGFLFSALMNEAWAAERFTAFDVLFQLMINGLMLLPLLALIFPAYTPYVTKWPAYLPVKRGQRFMVDVIELLICQRNIFCLLFVILFGFHLDLYQREWWLMSGTAIVLGNLLRLQVAQTLAVTYRPWVYASMVLLLLLVAAFEWILFSAPDQMVMTPVFAIGGLGLLMLRYVEPTYRKNILSRWTMSFGPLLKLHTNKKMRRLLLLAYLLRIYFLGMAVVQLRNPDSSGAGVYSVLMWMFVVPMPLFTYFYLNFWGNWRGLFHAVELRSGSIREFWRVQLNIMRWPLLIDFVLVAVFMVFCFPEKIVDFLLYYGLVVLMFVLLSLAGSLHLPMPYTEKNTAGKKTVSMWLSMACLLICACVYAIQWYWWLAFLPLLVLVGLVFYLRDVAANFRKYRYEVIRVTSNPEV
ncbi:hypothetical protein [Persicobacter diffluens]|uniref:Uncharacterized protein n=1 Tax=Persicobacter diffluens TaxID=981 RepID=A0AAN4VZA9_9BACT|nr:hypothetical protein PEDI_21270 [Persicobacter diffluens]